jgi:hypothetical protein
MANEQEEIQTGAEFENSAEETVNENVSDPIEETPAKAEKKPRKPAKPRAKKEKVEPVVETPEPEVVAEEVVAEEVVAEEVVAEEVVAEEVVEVAPEETEVEVETVEEEPEMAKKDWFKSELLKGTYAIYQNGVLITTSANPEVIHIADTYFQVNNKKYAYNGIEIKR